MLSYGYPRSLDRVRSLWGLDPDGLAATPHPFCLSGQFVFERYRSVTKAGKFSPSITQHEDDRMQHIGLGRFQAPSRVPLRCARSGQRAVRGVWALDRGQLGGARKVPEVASEGTRKGKRSGRGRRLGATEGKAPPRPPTSESDNNGGDVNAAGPGRAYLGEDDGVFGGLDFARSLRALSPPGLTNEDSYFEEKLGTTFLFGQRPEADLDELNGLFATVGFPQRDPTRLKRALVNSHHIVWCVVKDGNKNRSTHPGQCVGFARATSDTVFYATIWDVVVSPKWQGCGIGRGMVQRLVDKLVKEDIHNITLYTEPAVEGLYRTIGFETMDTATGMAFRHQRNARRVRGSQDTTR